MIEVPVYNKDGKEIEKVSVSEDDFGGEVKKELLHQVVTMYEANKRRGTVSTKDRGEVEGSTKKPWKQKHTGRARAGTIRSPIWRHGGVIFGPRPRDFGYDIPQALKQQALKSALLSKFQDKEAAILDALTVEKPRTREIVAVLKNIGIDDSCLIGIKDHNRTIHLSARNISGVKLLAIQDFNAYDVLKYNRLLLTREALNYLTGKKK